MRLDDEDEHMEYHDDGERAKLTRDSREGRKTPQDVEEWQSEDGDYETASEGKRTPALIVDGLKARVQDLERAIRDWERRGEDDNRTVGFPNWA